VVVFLARYREPTFSAIDVPADVIDQVDDGGAGHQGQRCGVVL
jgi:hypothetical protein